MYITIVQTYLASQDSTKRSNLIKYHSCNNVSCSDLARPIDYSRIQ